MFLPVYYKYYFKKMKSQFPNVCRKFSYKFYLIFIILLIPILLFLHKILSSYKFIPDEEIENELVPAPDTDRGTPSCPCLPKFKHDPTIYPVNVDEYNETEYALKYDIKPGGHWDPSQCRSRHEIAIIVPYRGRSKQLVTFLYYMHTFLQKQFLNYRIIVVEQTAKKEFNRGKLMNIGYAEAMKMSFPFHCFIFHDVDLIPQQLKNIYACTRKPRHMSCSINVWRYNLLYSGAFGGVIAILQEHFQLINGFSNIYYGWGGEDDDLLQRIYDNQLDICRFSPHISRYYMLKHVAEKKNPERNSLLKDALHRYHSDGLNSLHYQVLLYESKPLYTHFIVDI